MFTSFSTGSRARLLALPAFAVGAIAMTIATAAPASAQQAPIDLGSATSFAVLAGSTVTNTGPSVVSGDVGVSPGSAITGFRPPPAQPGLVINGSIHAADPVADLAQDDDTTAYNDAAGRSPVTRVPVELGGKTLVGGVYASATLGLTGTLTLSGDASSVWIFRAGSTLITSTASRIVLTGGATACNVFWQVGSSATLGSGSAFVGTVLAHTAITADAGASVRGRLFAQTAAVTLDSDTISRPACGADASPGSPGPTTSATGTPNSGTSSSSSDIPTTKPGDSQTPSAPAGKNSRGGLVSSATHHRSGRYAGVSAPHHPSAGPGTHSTGHAASTLGLVSRTTLASTGVDIPTLVVIALVALAGGGVALVAGRMKAISPRHRR